MSLKLYHTFFLSLFIFRKTERERERERAIRRQVEREGERIPSRLHTFSTEPDSGLHFRHREIMT